MDKSYYERNPEKFRARNEDTRLKNTILILEYLKVHPCVDCGEKDVLVLEFDHREGKPEQRVTKLVSWNWEAILKEIEKCDVRCANCHTRVTHQRANTFRWQYINSQ